MALAHHVSARRDASEMRVVDDDELSIQRFAHVELDHAGAESHGRSKRSGGVLQGVRGCAAMSNDDGYQAVFWRFNRLPRNLPGFRYTAGWTLMMSKLGLRSKSLG